MVRVLIVDDSVDMRKVLHDTLCSRFPFLSILEAHDSEQARRHLDGPVPDLMFVDIRLPGENGLSLTRRIRSVHSGVAIIILTNHDSPEYSQAAFASGADRFMSKATSASHDIVATVEHLMIERGLLAKQGNSFRTTARGPDDPPA